jgi:Flp pilus assembly protein TadG
LQKEFPVLVRTQPVCAGAGQAGSTQTRRHGAALMEFAFVAPSLFLLVLGLTIGGLGIFRYQEVAWLAREGARYASVRGYEYEQVTQQPAATPQDVYNNVILPSAIALNPAQITYSVSWNPDNRQKSMVTVTVNYQWIPEGFLGGVTLSSTSSMMVSY